MEIGDGDGSQVRSTSATGQKRREGDGQQTSNHPHKLPRHDAAADACSRTGSVAGNAESEVQHRNATEIDLDDDIPLDKLRRREARVGDAVDVFWEKPAAFRGWWRGRVERIRGQGKASMQHVVRYESDNSKCYYHLLIHQNHIQIRDGHHAWRLVPAAGTGAVGSAKNAEGCNGGGIEQLEAAVEAGARAVKGATGANGSTYVAGCADFPLHRLLVVAKCFWYAFRDLCKHVEFRPEGSLTTIKPGMFLLLCPPLDVRRKECICLLLAEVVEIVILSLHDSYNRFPSEASDCDLATLRATWKSRNIGCVIVKGVRLAPEFACLAPGNEGFLHQFSQDKSTPQFCSRIDVGKMATLRIVSHGTVKTVQRRLVNLDSCLTDAGDCLPNCCSGPGGSTDAGDCRQGACSGQETFEVNHPQ